MNLDPLAESESLECFRCFLSEVGVSRRCSINHDGFSLSSAFRRSRKRKKSSSATCGTAGGSGSCGRRTSSTGDPRSEIETKHGEHASPTIGGTIRGKSAQRPEQPCSLVIMCHLTGKKNTRISHRLGACFWVLGVDYLRFHFAGTVMPTGAISIKFAAGAPKLEQSIGLKVVRARLRPAFHQRGEGRSRPPKTSGVRAWTRARVRKRLVTRSVPLSL